MSFIGYLFSSNILEQMMKMKRQLGYVVVLWVNLLLGNDSMQNTKFELKMKINLHMH
jgi:hypothetical protein